MLECFENRFQLMEKNALKVSWFHSHSEQQRVETTFNKPFRSESAIFPSTPTCGRNAHFLLNGQDFFLQCLCLTLLGNKRKVFGQKYTRKIHFTHVSSKA